VIENAGAQKGLSNFRIMNDNLVIEAQGTVEQEDCCYLKINLYRIKRS
jgi:hypothetical protein